MNVKTAVGYPKIGKKRDYLYQIEQDPLTYIVDEDIMDQLEWCIERLTNGQSCHFLFRMTPKSEVISAAKEDIGKTREFFVGQMVLIILLRWCFLSILEYMKSLREVSEIAIGVNAASKEWLTAIKNCLDALGTEYEQYYKHGDVADLDAKDFDIRNQLLGMSLRLCCDLVKDNIHFDRIRTLMWALASDMTQFYIVANGDLIKVINHTPSGGSITAETNSISNQISNRIAFYAYNLIERNIAFSEMEIDDVIKYYEVYGPFDRFVRIKTYGDDLLLKVSSEIKENYTLDKIVYYHGLFGMKLTPADKGSTFKWKTWSEVSFLKRTFRSDEETGYLMAPLDEASIRKMLCFVDTASPLTKVDYLSNICMDALRNWFLHGRIVYEYEKGILYDHIIKVSKRPDYNGIVSRINWYDYDELMFEYEKDQFSSYGI